MGEDKNESSNDPISEMLEKDNDENEDKIPSSIEKDTEIKKNINGQNNEESDEDDDDDEDEEENDDDGAEVDPLTLCRSELTTSQKSKDIEKSKTVDKDVEESEDEVHIEEEEEPQPVKKLTIKPVPISSLTAAATPKTPSVTITSLAQKRKLDTSQGNADEDDEEHMKFPMLSQQNLKQLLERQKEIRKILKEQKYINRLLKLHGVQPEIDDEEIDAACGHPNELRKLVEGDLAKEMTVILKKDSGENKILTASDLGNINNQIADISDDSPQKRVNQFLGSLTDRIKITDTHVKLRNPWSPFTSNGRKLKEDSSIGILKNKEESGGNNNRDYFDSIKQDNTDFTQRVGFELSHPAMTSHPALAMFGNHSAFSTDSDMLTSSTSLSSALAAAAAGAASSPTKVTSALTNHHLKRGNMLASSGDDNAPVWDPETETMRYACRNKCGATLASAKGRRKHEKRHCPNSGSVPDVSLESRYPNGPGGSNRQLRMPSYDCKLCGKILRSEEGLRVHEKVQHGLAVTSTASLFSKPHFSNNITNSITASSAGHSGIVNSIISKPIPSQSHMNSIDTSSSSSDVLGESSRIASIHSIFKSIQEMKARSIAATNGESNLNSLFDLTS